MDVGWLQIRSCSTEVDAGRFKLNVVRHEVDVDRFNLNVDRPKVDPGCRPFQIECYSTRSRCRPVQIEHPNWFVYSLMRADWSTTKTTKFLTNQRWPPRSLIGPWVELRRSTHIGRFKLNFVCRVDVRCSNWMLFRFNWCRAMYFNRFQGNRVHLGPKKAKIWPNISKLVRNLKKSVYFTLCCPKNILNRYEWM